MPDEFRDLRELAHLQNSGKKFGSGAINSEEGSDISGRISVRMLIKSDD